MYMKFSEDSWLDFFPEAKFTRIRVHLQGERMAVIKHIEYATIWWFMMQENNRFIVMIKRECRVLCRTIKKHIHTHASCCDFRDMEEACKSISDLLTFNDFMMVKKTCVLHNKRKFKVQEPSNPTISQGPRPSLYT